MKAITAVCSTGASVPAIANGRVSRPHLTRNHHNNNNNHSLRDSGENAEIQMYLSKLKDLVPFMPKNRKLSKLEVILNVIDYICDLQTALESHPAVNSFDAQTVLNGLQQQQQQQNAIINNNNRQPLGVRNSQQNYSISNNSSEQISEYTTNYTTSDKISTTNHLTDRL